MPDKASQASALTIRGTTAVMFIVAEPVAQVKAPEALNLIFASAGIDAVMVPVRISGPHLHEFVTVALRAGNVRGTLVSIPHKTALVAHLDRLDDDARSAGAVNAIRRVADGSLEGAQFDGVGFVGALRHHGIGIAQQRVLLLGAGGAGLAIASALGRCAEGVARLAIHDTDQARASALARRLAGAGVPAVIADSSDPDGYGLIVNATPLGLRADDPLPVDVDQLQSGQAVFDILMKNDPTPLERACHEHGVVVFSGHEMMVQQVPAYLQFFGFPEVAERLNRPGDPVLADVRRLLRGSRVEG